jgi:hypothetical protein
LRAFTLSFCLAPACSLAVDSEEAGGAAEPGTGAEPATGGVTRIDEVNLENGAVLTVEEAPGGVLLFALESQEDLSDKVSELDSVEALYEALAPGRAMPERVAAAIEQSESSAITAVRSAEEAGGLEATGELARELDVDTAVDAALVQAKEAPRNVTAFRNSYCYSDKILEADIGENVWYRKNEQCGTEKTGVFTHHLYGSNQGYVALYMYRGSSTLAWDWKELGASNWTAGNTYSVSEGAYKAFWVKTTVDRDFRFRLTNSEGDGYNYAIHNARSNSGDMKITAGNDYYHTLCQCNDSFTIANYVIEHCSINRSESDVQQTARFWCGRQQEALTLALGRTVPCRALAVERVSTGPQNCQLLGATRECTFQQNCRYECNDICID